MTMLDRLSVREKGLVIGGGVLLLLIGLWLYVGQPLMQQRALQEDRIARYLAVLDITDQFDPMTRDTATHCAQTTALGPRITQSAEAFGVPLTRLDPEGPRLRITVAETGYVAAMMWISELEARICVRAISVEMSRLPQPGQVSLRMTLEDAR